MIIDRHTVANKLTGYLYHNLSLGELVDWAEWAMMEADLDEKNVENLRAVIARLGVADVRAFNLSWRDCESMLQQLGYRVQLQVMAA
ncbi:MAG: hypothetical protein KDI03_16675 [Anaerolineae bacterium]|nr:hypothetical protein [Anaerolineae bacterium]MCB0201701.1 hypothetical protein [Anaerolineae bacterium]MCB0206144.1 hypothetical protein [Anaerolineae bacterium]MCB0254133.1 hypothetical protein [Anaerolineae bacterium]